MTELKTRRLFADLIPPLSIDERGELENSIMDEGCRDAICVWNGVIVDGHNRYEICKRRGRAFRVKEMDFASDAEAVEWIIRNQFARRNLNAMQRAELALRLKAAIAEEAKQRQKEHGHTAPGKAKTLRENSHEVNERTDEKLATMAGVSSNTIRRVEKIVTEAAPEVVEATRKGDMSINAAFKTITPAPAPKPEPPPTPQPKPTPAPIAAEPPRRMKNWERFSERHEAELAHAREKIIFGCGWGQIEWLYMDYIPDEPRIDYLRRLDKHGILKSDGRRELKSLEKKTTKNKENHQ